MWSLWFLWISWGISNKCFLTFQELFIISTIHFLSPWSLPNPHHMRLIQMLCNPFGAVWFILSQESTLYAFNLHVACHTCRGAANLILIHSGGNKQVTYGVKVSCSTNYCRKVIPSSWMEMSNSSLQSNLSVLILLMLHYGFVWAVWSVSQSKVVNPQPVTELGKCADRSIRYIIGHCFLFDWFVSWSLFRKTFLGNS